MTLKTNVMQLKAILATEHKEGKMKTLFKKESETEGIVVLESSPQMRTIFGPDNSPKEGDG